MKTKSINIIVRDALLDNGLPLHYYTRYLHHALRITDELSMDFNLGNVKTAELDVTSYQRAILPSDYIDFIDVSAKEGEKILPLERERNLNKRYNYDTAGNKIVYPSSVSTNEDELIRMHYGRERVPKLIFDIDEVNQEIVFGNEMSLTKVTLTYLTSAVSRSTANVVTPYATDVITKYVQMMAVKAEGTTLGKYQLAKQEYDNARRIFRSRMNATDFAEVLGSIRNGIVGSLKN